ncbi:MAG: hypothetical protein E7092_05745 [Bacteroidales bacterium]|nr:hypothetical protein [Bacteroidales bacterium]
MKRLTNIALMLIMALGTYAQSTYDAINFFNPDLVGTARFVGMGGSMSALGGDISTMSTNPAGIGIYRSNDVAVSASLNLLNTKADFLGSVVERDNTQLSFDNFGLVLAGYCGEGTLRYLNLGLNISHRNNFRKDFAMNGWYADGDFSQQYQMQSLYDQSLPDLENINCYSYMNPRYPWLPLLAYDAGIIDATGGINYLPTDATYYSEERGGTYQVDCNLSCNINDRLYLGMTIGVQSIDYKRYSIYSEYDDVGVIYDLENNFKTEGEATEIKFGAILRPFEYSPFRMGLAFHLPTYYSLTDYSSAYIAGPSDENGKYKEMATNWESAYGEDYIVDYTVRSPWRMNVSAGYTFDNFIALNAEYELVDYSSAKMEYQDGPEMPDMNEEFRSNMKCSHIFRLGAEMRLDDNLSMRCGYNYISSAFEDDAWKYISPSSACTATEYTNTAETNIFSLGLGYHGKSIYFDAAYQCMLQNAEFYPYVDPELQIPATDVSLMRNKLVLTIGARF